MFSREQIQVKTPDQVRHMRRAGLVVAQVHAALREAVAPGVTTAELDAVAAGVIAQSGARPNFLGYHGYPATVCVSVNEEVVHGIPGTRRLRAGDLVTFDCGAYVVDEDGTQWHGDAAFTTVVGGTYRDPLDDLLDTTTHEALWSAVAAVAAAVQGGASGRGGRLNVVGDAVEAVVERVAEHHGHRLGILREYVGHGIGTQMHMPPDVLNYSVSRRGPRLRPGVVLAIEPMLTAGPPRVRELDDGWTVVTCDGSRAAQWEHTVAVLPGGVEITKLAPYDRPINMMFQSYALFPHMTVEQNIAFGLKQDKMPKGEIDARVEEMLRLVQMTKFAKRKPHQLSGGQQQRIALARSLAKRPKILLLDEPLGALDKKLRQQTQLELVNTLEQVGVTCIMVTHDQEEAMTMATRIAIMSDGQLQQVGTPSDVYDYPNSRFTAEFIGETNIFEGVVIDDHADYAIIQCEGLENHVRIDHGLGGPAEQDLWVSIRPEDIDVYKDKPEHLGDYNWAQGTVEEIAYLGSFAIYHIKLPNGRMIKSQVPAPYWYVRNITPPTWDETVYVSWPENQPTPLFR